MRYLIHLTVAAFAVLLLANAAPAEQGAKAGEGTAKGYIVVLKDDVASVNATIDRLVAPFGVTTTYQYYSAFKGFAANLTPAQTDALRADPSVEFVSVDHVGSVIADVPIKPGETVPPGIR